MALPIEQPADYGTTRGGVRSFGYTDADGRYVTIYTPQRQPIASRREGRLREAPARGGGRFVGVGQYTLENSRGTEHLAIRRYDRQAARDYLASIGKGK